MAIADVLSHCIGVTLVWSSPKSSSINLSQIACAAASDALTYSTSTVDNAKQICLTEAQEKTPVPKENAYLDMLLLSLTNPPQLLSQKLISIASSLSHTLDYSLKSP